MPVAVLVFGMILLLPVARLEGKWAFLRTPLIVLTALLQTAYFVYYLFTLERPPLQ